jgi:predicted SAM-dependent methyltransferase
MRKLNYLNLGCGDRYINNWINIDLFSDSNNVIRHDLAKGIPFGDRTCAVIYHSHVLEHFSRQEAELFLNECFRVLKPQGIIRIAVPDLEQLAHQYINSLQTALSEPSSLNHANYEWSIIELLDQIAREVGGGEMSKYWKQPTIINESVVITRLGDEFLRFRKTYRADDSKGTRRQTLYEKLRRFFFSKLKINTRHLETGRFRHGGEVHKWMYDRYSLQHLLKNIGFIETKVQTAFNSSIPDWEQFIELDVKDGKVRKPDSLFVEGKKP